MGIKGIYKEIGSGQRVSLCKLAVDQLEQTGRPLRLAIDIAIWQFQVQAAKGGANPAIRTLFYRLVRLLGLSIQPLFVFDGPNKPAFKRNKRSSGPGNSIATAMAKRLIKLFGFDIHDAPGEAEAECALLQRQGIVDAVLSEDVDTIMFGCSRTLRNWTAESKGAKTPTHVSMYDVAKLGQSESGLDREGMVLVAMMSGGDYVPAGVPGCGVKVACEAAKGGFGRSLCKIKRSDKAAQAAWRENLVHELRTNESGFFRTRHKALEIPEDFPDMEVLRYYTHPVVSQDATVEKLRREFPSKKDVDVVALREFVRETFDWTYKIGAVKYIRVLAPSLLVQALLNGPASGSSQDEATFVNAISSKRSHFSTDATSELRISYVPNDVVRIDLSTESEEVVSSFGRDGLALNSDDEFEEEDPAKGNKKVYDPLSPDLVWIPETVAKIGAPLAVEEWQNNQRTKESKAASKTTRKTRAKPTGMPIGALDKYVKVTKTNDTATKEVGTTISSSSLPNLLASPDPRPSRQAFAVIQSPSQPSLPSPARSKPLPSKTSMPKKSNVPAAAKRAAQTNPWTLAGSQVSPSVTKYTSVTKNTSDNEPASSPKAPPSASQRRRRGNEPIIISSSPPASPSPAAVASNVSLVASSRSKRASTPPAEHSFVADPFGEGLGPSPRKQRSPPARRHGESFTCDAHASPAAGPAVNSVLRRTAESDSTGSPKRKPRTKRTKSGASNSLVQKQTSIMEFVLKEAGGDRVNAQPPAASSISAGNNAVEISSDDDDDDLFPPVSSLKPLSMDSSQSQKSLREHPSIYEDDGSACGRPKLSSQDRTRQENRNHQANDDEGEDPFLEPSPSSISRARERSSAKPVTEQEARSSGKTKLYIPRKSGIGYFKEIEVTREEADRIIAGDSTHEAVRGSYGRILRRSEVGMIDLTELDD